MTFRVAPEDEWRPVWMPASTHFIVSYWVAVPKVVNGVAITKIFAVHRPLTTGQRVRVEMNSENSTEIYDEMEKAGKLLRLIAPHEVDLPLHEVES